MDDFYQIRAVFIGTFTSLWDCLVWMLTTTRDSGVSPSIPGIVAMLAAAALWLGSGFAAASVAEAREGKRFLHLLLGLLIPLFYPLALLLLMPKPVFGKDLPRKAENPTAQAAEPAAEVKEEKVEPASLPGSGKVEDRPTDRMIPLPPRDSSTAKVRMEETYDSTRTQNFAAQPRNGSINQQSGQGGAHGPIGEMTQKRFAALATDSAGNSRGPFMIETADGRFLEAIRISSALPELLVLEMQGEGGKVRNVRLPYAKIVNCKLKSEWLGQ